VKVSDAESDELLHTLHGHELWVDSLAFSPDGLRLAGVSVKYAGYTLRVWDLQTGACLEIIRGGRCAADAAEAKASLPWQAVQDQLETTIRSAATGQPVAWLSQPVRRLTAHPSGRTWAGEVDKYVFLFTLEPGPSLGQGSCCSTPAGSSGR
jgi:WD40 repeat protein